MPHIALVGIALFRGTAVNRAFAHDLSAVEKNACFFIEKLHGRDLFKLSFFIKRIKKLLSKLCMDLLAPVKSGSGEKIWFNGVFFKCVSLFVVIASYKVLKAAVKLSLFHLLSPALCDR